MENIEGNLEHYDPNSETHVWLAPLGHREIDYGIFDEVDTEGNKIFFIGKIKGEPSHICDFRGLIIAFIDEQGNVVSPVLFHDPLTISIGYYKTMLTEIGKFAKPISDEQVKEEKEKSECFADALYESFLGDKKIFIIIEEAIYRGLVKADDPVIRECNFSVEEVIKELEKIFENPQYYEDKYYSKLHAIIEALQRKGVPQGEQDLA